VAAIAALLLEAAPGLSAAQVREILIGSAVDLGPAFSSDGIPIGTYNVFTAMFRQGSLADNVLGDGDLIWLDFFPLAYAP
jgi:hypothetical protein